MAIPIVFAEPDTTIRRAIASLVGLQDDLEIVAEASRVPEALAAVLRYRPRVLLLADSLADVTSIEQFKDADPTMRITVLGMVWPGLQAVQALDVFEFVLRDRTDTLMAAIRRAAESSSPESLSDDRGHERRPPSPRP